MIFLRSINIEQGGAAVSYPMGIPALRGLERMEFGDVTVFVGENGSGKSTLLEALARRLRLPAAGFEDAAGDATLSAVQPLSDRIKTVFSRRQSTGMFMRAEDFFGYTRRISALQRELKSELARVEEEYADASAFTQGQARMAYASALSELNAAHGADPDARSHGESFLHLFQNRIRPGGLYILDEPEAPLSPLRQLALMSMLLEHAQDSQFIIATHSPILAAYPGAALYSFDESPAARTTYGELEGINLMRDFLNAPERFLRKL